MKQYYPDQPELSDGYVTNMRKRSQEILASLSPKAREMAKIIGKDLDRSNG
jgi:hypothetical protein